MNNYYSEIISRQKNTICEQERDIARMVVSEKTAIALCVALRARAEKAEKEIENMRQGLRTNPGTLDSEVTK